VCALNAGGSGCSTVAFSTGGPPPPPNVTITGGPADGSTINTNTATFSFVSSQPVTQPTPCSDPNQICVQVIVDVTPFFCSVDSGSYVACGNHGLSSGSSFTTGALADGARTFCVYTSASSGVSPTVCRQFTASSPTLQFTPSFNQSLTNPAAGQPSGFGQPTDFSWAFSTPSGSDSIKSVKILEDPGLSPNFASFGSPSTDMCPASSMPSPTSTFSPASCPSQARIGSFTATVSGTSVTGTAYLINQNPMPWIGVTLSAPIPGSSVSSLGAIGALPQVDPTCDPDVAGYCQRQIQFTINNLPNIPGAQYRLDVNSSGRTSSAGAALQPGLFSTPSSDSDLCTGQLTTNASFGSTNGLSATIVDTDPITGCGGSTTTPSSDYTRVSVGYLTTCAVTTAHTARCWGGEARKLAQGGSGDSSTPLDVLTAPGGSVLSGIASISVGSGGSACVLMQDTTIKCWGYNAYGQTGDGTVGGETVSPTTVVLRSGLEHPADRCHGHHDPRDHQLRADGRWWRRVLGLQRGRCGRRRHNDRPQHSDSVVTSRTNSAPLSNVAFLSPSGGHTCAVLNPDYSVVCWGDNSLQAINNTGVNALAPTPVYTGGALQEFR
jgi:hypothetical protein